MRLLPTPTAAAILSITITHQIAFNGFDQPIDATPTDVATDGNQFRLTTPDWHFNLSTKGSGFTAGTYLLIATLQDGTKHSVWVSIKK